MAYLLSEINRRCAADAKGYIEECDAVYTARIAEAAEKILQNMERSPIVLLSGPSGSGKTTTAMKIAEELERRGVRTHSVSMDNYFQSLRYRKVELTPEGLPDLESPTCMDMALLNEHFSRLSRGECVQIPKFEFARQIRIQKPSQTLCLGKGEIAVFEGIHALNDTITDVHPEAFKLYISARSNVVDDNDHVVFKGTWMRLCRRSVRDYLFRGTAAADTLAMWANVRRGEKLYISPFKHKADLQFDSSFPYEVPVLNNLATELFESIPEGVERYEELKSILPAFALFEDVDPDLLAPDSMLREFIGGGKYRY
jgi:uridine kinase